MNFIVSEAVEAKGLKKEHEDFKQHEAEQAKKDWKEDWSRLQNLE